MKRIPVLIAGAALAVAAIGSATFSAQPGAAATAPPPPPQPGAVVTPSATMQPMQATPTPIPLLTIGKTPVPAATNAPKAPADKRVGYEGVWEVQLQRGEQTTYTHFSLKQTATALTGVYLDKDNKKYPIAGSIDGQTIRLVVSMPDGSTQIFTGKVTGTTDMLGMMAKGNDSIPFTAAYRPKENWLENVNAAPGGMGGGLPSNTSPNNPNVPH